MMRRLFLLAILLLAASGAYAQETIEGLVTSLKECTTNDPNRVADRILSRDPDGTVIAAKKLEKLKRRCHDRNAKRVLGELRVADTASARDYYAVAFALYAQGARKAWSHYKVTPQEEAFIAARYKAWQSERERQRNDEIRFEKGAPITARLSLV